MEKNQLKTIGIVCLVVCAISVFVGLERYESNAANVRAMNEMQGTQQQLIQQSPLAGMVIGGHGQLEPGIPVATKYAAFFALLSGIGGTVLLVKSRRLVPTG